MTTEQDKTEPENAKRTPAAGTTPAAPAMDREGWNRRYATKELIWTGAANRFLEAEAADLPPGRALDLAAGEGRNAIWLAERGWTVSAVDFSDVAIKKAEKLAAERKVADKIAFQAADLRSYTFEKNHFDLVALIYLQIPQEELIPILERAVQAVTPGGVFLVIAHDSENLKHGYGGPQNPDMLYTAQQVATAVDGAVRIEKAQRVERPVETDDGVKIAIDCLVRGIRL
ncbi:class I SAM-dependent methyltransferase [Varunaivibrio sulfuroxidans]|uniref:Methyltransferase family protein n=1 Tax=Varunaivibrio sulfuroxidans TaxID=1773489 RepID=A0A4R3JCT7_9PROT|nr:class I SAM-dependent methyltransferase [Varunaivibrio sulfuroxidans]TCS62953.1 methyltransferase family protein [Varunaivibrio sulfuroxidans]WES31971.1 class I SAM-dependent methyltransferase [Varunaivibrio sulfuroxidans]